MPIPLTSQEKKVLGFILFLLLFGLAVLGAQKLFGKSCEKTERQNQAKVLATD